MGEEVWRYNRGSWSRMSSPVDFEDESGEQLDAPAGYSPNTRWFGEEGEFGIEVYSADPEADAKAPTPYLAMVYSVGDNMERIFVEDFPSLLQLLREMAPVLDLPNSAMEPEGDEYDEDGLEEE